MVQTIAKTLILLLLSNSYCAAETVLPGPLTRVLESGDGLTPRSAYMADGIDEHYLVLEHLGVRPDMHSAEFHDGVVFDVYTSAKHKLYFTQRIKAEAI